MNFKPTEKDIDQAKQYLPRGYVKDLSERLELSRTTISQTLNGRGYNHQVALQILKDAASYIDEYNTIKSELLDKINQYEQPDTVERDNS